MSQWAASYHHTNPARPAVDALHRALRRPPEAILLEACSPTNAFIHLPTHTTTVLPQYFALSAPSPLLRTAASPLYLPTPSYDEREHRPI